MINTKQFPRISIFVSFSQYLFVQSKVKEKYTLVHRLGGIHKMSSKNIFSFHFLSASASRSLLMEEYQPETER